jgi:ABC-type transport system involved in multi-copper enzyme maturation permease subunit
MERLPVAYRELRLASRRGQTFWGRCAAAGLALAVAAFIVKVVGLVAPRELGLALFVGLFWTAFIVALGVGTLLVSDSISGEVREGTLGLLFLTDLRPSDVLAGKLAAGSLSSVYSLLAILPVLGLPMLCGGVGGMDYLRASLVLLLTLAWSLSLSLFLSTFRGGFQQVQTRSVAFTLLIAGGLPGIGGILQAVLLDKGFDGTSVRLLVAPLFLLSPGTTLAFSMPQVFQGWYMGYLLGVVTLAATSAGLLFATQRRLRHAWKDRPEAAGRPGIVERLRTFVRSRTLTSGNARREILDTIPFTWPNLRSRWKGWNPWIGGGVILAGWAGIGLAFGSDFFEFPAWVAMSILLHLHLKACLSNDAQRSFFDARRSGAMELLLTLPIDDRRHVQEHLLALRRNYLKPILSVLVLDAGITVWVLSGDALQNADSIEWMLSMAGRGGFLVLDSLALAHFGLWIGASTRRTQLRQEPFLIVIMGPWLVLLLMLTLGGLRGGLDFKGFLMMTLVVGAIFSLLALTYAKSRLKGDFRAAASLAPGMGATVLTDTATVADQSTGRTM